MAGSGATRIQKSCDVCKKYLDHLDGKNQNVRSFLSLMTASSKHSMVVPKRFVEHFAGKLSGIIKLESPNCGSYDVEVTEHYNKVVFQHGWGQFVESHHIKENEYLLFRHVEGSCFEVLIFDPDGCEKVFSCAGIRSSDYGDILSSSHYETTKSSASERLVRCQKDHVKAFSEHDYVLPAQCHLTAEQEEKIVALVKKVQPEIPVLVVQIKKSIFNRLCSSLVIFKGYAAQYFPQESQSITLECPGGKKWRSRFHVRRDRCGYTLRAQWQNIARYNRLREDDICLFQPMPSEKGFRVMIHLLCEPSTHSSSSDGHVHVLRSHMKRGVTSTAHVHEKSGSENSRPLDMHKRQAVQQGHHDSLSGYESIQSDHVNAFSKRSYVLSARCHLTVEQEEKIVALVKKVQPEIPVLVVQMKKSNVNCLNSNLVICKDYAVQHFPQESQFITLERPGGKSWRTRLHVRPGGFAYMLTAGWRDFVHDNHLLKDGICLFQPMPSEKGFRVMVHLLCDINHTERGVTSTVNIQEKSGSENSGSLDLHKRQTVQQRHQVLSDCGGASSSKPPLYVVLGGTCLTPAQDKAVQQKAMAIKAEVSIFVATMNNKILGCNNEAFILDFSDAAQYLPDGTQALMLRQQSQGKAWRTNLQNRLMLGTGEWRQFARDSGLEDGDICLFEPIKNEKLAMLVHIIHRQQYS